MKRARWGVAGALGAMGLAIACSTTPAVPFPDITSFCTAKAQAECVVSNFCSEPTPAACITARTQACQTDAQTAKNANRAYTQPNAQACITLVQQKYTASNPYVSAADVVAVNKSCDRVFSGTADNNAACTSDSDCINGRVCPRGFCGDPATKALGQDCNNPGDSCTGSSCAPSSSTPGAPFVCIPLLARGAVCARTAQCAVGDHCITGTCQARSLAGQLCATSDDCDPAVSYCDPYAAHTCQTGQIFAAGTAICAAFGGSGSSTPPDAGGGPPDAGPPAVDSGTTDAGGD